MTLQEFAIAAHVYCALMGASVTSGTRSRRRNLAVGGVQHSAHLYGVAVDVVYDDPGGVSYRVETARRLGLRVITESDHDHLQPLDWRAG